VSTYPRRLPSAAVRSTSPENNRNRFASRAREAPAILSPEIRRREGESKKRSRRLDVSRHSLIEQDLTVDCAGMARLHRRGLSAERRKKGRPVSWWWWWISCHFHPCATRPSASTRHNGRGKGEEDGRTNCRTLPVCSGNERECCAASIAADDRFSCCDFPFKNSRWQTTVNRSTEFSLDNETILLIMQMCLIDVRCRPIAREGLLCASKMYLARNHFYRE